jgi:hypothetical protein
MLGFADRDRARQCIRGPTGSIPMARWRSSHYHSMACAAARMAKLVDARDLKSLDRKVIPVRFRVRAPEKQWVVTFCLQIARLEGSPQ